MSNFAHQQPNFFEFPQQGADFSHMMYAQHPPNSYLSPPPQSPFQLCELIYTSVPTPNGMQLTPSFVPVSPVENGQVYGSHAPSPVPPPHQNYMQAPMKMNEMERKVEGVNKANAMQRSNLNLVNGIPAEQWKCMTDKEREDFLKTKRRQEAFKSALCQAFQRTGDCRYGDECRFAHGKDELQLPKYNHPKYKTVLCRNYAVTGLCPYGSRCQFIHEKYQGAIPEEYIVSIESTQVMTKPKKLRKTMAFKNDQFSDEDKQKLIEFRGGEKVREAKKELQENNENNYFTDMSETFNELFDAKKFSRSCKPRIEI